MTDHTQTPIAVPVTLDEGAEPPSYSSTEASGADVRAHITESITLEPTKSALIPTGIKMEIPRGYEIQVRPRSGLAFKNGITVLNTPGTIDSDYRGELAVILINHGSESFEITNGMRIAQLVLAPVVQAEWTEALALNSTERGSGGFGHTGIH